MGEHEQYGFTTSRLEWCKKRGIDSSWSGVEPYVEGLEAQLKALREPSEIDKHMLSDSFTEVLIDLLGAVMFPPEPETDTATIMNSRKDMLVHKYRSNTIFHARVQFGVSVLMVAVEAAQGGEDGT
jgi:hypothetical protein